MEKRPVRSMIVGAALSAAVSCGEAQDTADYTQAVRFDSSTIRVVTPRDTIRFRVELAVSPEQRTMGLMERTSLPDSGGMLFLYEQDEPANAGFWMFRTRIPLDIAFLDSAGVVVATHTMQPCPATLASGCPSYEPGAPYRAALEVNAGVLARRGIGVGARVQLPPR